MFLLEVRASSVVDFCHLFVLLYIMRLMYTVDYAKARFCTIKIGVICESQTGIQLANKAYFWFITGSKLVWPYQ